MRGGVGQDLDQRGLVSDDPAQPVGVAGQEVERDDSA